MTLAKLLKDVTLGRAEASLSELFQVFQFPTDESTLAKVDLTASKVAELGWRFVPDINQGDLDTPRRIVFAQPDPVTVEIVKSELSRRETADLELKSSLLFDHKRSAADAKASKDQLRSETVLHSSLKTIAAFLTSAGGVLYVGVNDEGGIVGIEHDFDCMTSNPGRRNPDGWELVLRSFVRDRFKDGENVNDYITCDIVEIEGKLVARIKVAPRKSLSFVKGKDGFGLYRRQGNQTVQVTIEQLEEFIEFRRSFSE